MQEGHPSLQNDQDTRRPEVTTITRNDKINMYFKFILTYEPLRPISFLDGGKIKRLSFPLDCQLADPSLVSAQALDLLL